MGEETVFNRFLDAPEGFAPMSGETLQGSSTREESERITLEGSALPEIVERLKGADRPLSKDEMSLIGVESGDEVEAETYG